MALFPNYSGWFDWFKPKPPQPTEPPKGDRRIDFNVEPHGSVATLTPKGADGSTPFGTFTAATDPEAPWHRTFTLGPDVPIWGADFVVQSDGWLPYHEWVILPATNTEWPTVFLQPEPPPAPDLREPTPEEFWFIKDNFCNIQDSKGRLIFSPFIASLPPDEQGDWFTRLLGHGDASHITIAPECAYPRLHNQPGYPPPFNWMMEPQRFGDLVRLVRNQRTNAGHRAIPIIFMDGGGKGFRERIDAFWPDMIAAIRDALDGDVNKAHWSPVWEQGASDTTSAEFNYAVEFLYAHGVRNIWPHCSQGRHSFASWPHEADDPWQGDEAACWKTHCGPKCVGLLYQTPSTRQGDQHIPCPTPFQYENNDHFGWRDRSNDGIGRLVCGDRGWRIVKFVPFESAAFHSVDNPAGAEQFAREIARRHREHMDAYDAAWKARGGPGVVYSGYGNGLP